jgi:two-component system, LytTR family, sensor kinase
LDRIFISRNLWLYYSLFWIILAIVQFGIASVVYEQSFAPAATDSLLSNLIFAFVGIGLWFMVRFSGKMKRDLLRNLIYQAAVCTVSVLIWLFFSYSLLESLFGTDKEYINYMDGSLVIRLLIGVLIYFLLVSIFYLILSFEEMQEQAEHEAELSAMLRDAELNMLRSQIRPHFLFNSLNSVSALTLSNPAAAQQMIIRLSEFMRHSLSLGAEAMNTLEEELHHAGLYLDIEKVRFSDRLIVEKNCSSECVSIPVPAMILQPLLENAVKYGIGSTIGFCTLSIDTECTDASLDITISNTFDPDAVPGKGTGTGLSHVRKRMAALYGRTDLLTVSSSGGMFCARLRIPVLPVSA